MEFEAAALPDNLCHVTICYGDEADRGWAVKAWQSLRKPTDSNEG